MSTYTRTFIKKKDMPSPVCRPFLPTDLDRIQSLYREHIAYNEKNYMSMGEGPALQATALNKALAQDLASPEAIHKVYDTPGCFLVLEESEGVVVGCVGLQYHAETEVAEVRRMSIAASHQRRGLGSVLIKGVMEHARLHGIQALELGTFSGFVTACKFYEALGFMVGEGTGAPQDKVSLPPWGNWVTYRKVLNS